MITFIDVDLTKDGINHKNALYIIIATRGKYVSMGLVDNKSRLNMCLLKVARCLGLGLKDFTPTEQTMKAYNNSKMKVIEIVFMDVTIVMAQFLFEF